MFIAFFSLSFPSVSHCIFPEWTMTSLGWGWYPCTPQRSLCVPWLLSHWHLMANTNERITADFPGVCFHPTWQKLQKITELRKWTSSGCVVSLWEVTVRGSAMGWCWKGGQPATESSRRPQRKAKPSKAKMSRPESSSGLVMVVKVWLHPVLYLLSCY